jgi:hypothetical protein
MNAPKKIWVDEPDVFIKPIVDTDTPYIRADLVDELVEALTNLINETCEICETAYSDEIEATYINARAALAKLEESHEI